MRVRVPDFQFEGSTPGRFGRLGGPQPLKFDSLGRLGLIHDMRNLKRLVTLLLAEEQKEQYSSNNTNNNGNNNKS